MNNKNKNNKIKLKYRFPEFNNSDWNKCTLKNITKHNISKVGNKRLTTLSISAGIGFETQANKFSKDISGKQYNNYIHIKKGDFSYNKGNSKQFPQGCIYQLKTYEDAAVPNAYITFTFKKDYAKDFFEGYFCNNAHGKQLSRFITSSARMDGLLNISAEDFFSMNFYVPDAKKEQEKIAECLKSVDDLILLEEEKLEKLKSHKNGLLQKLFPKDNKSMPELRFPQYKEQWLLEKLIKKVIYKNGKAHEDSIVINGRYIVVNSKFISTNGLIKKYSNSPNLLAKKGDILVVLSDVPNGKALGKCFMVDKDETYTVNQRVCCLTPVNIDKKYLFFILNRNNYFLSFDDGIGQTNLKKEDVLAFSFYAPQNSKEQQKIANCISSIDDLISAQTRKIELLKQHKKGLLQGLFPSIEEVEND